MNVVLKIRRKNQGEWGCLFAIFMPFAFGLLIDGLGFPSFVKYSIDIAWLFLSLILLLRQCRFPNTESKKLFQGVVIFWITTVIGSLLALQNPLYYIWGFRNNFRFFVVFFSCIIFLKRQYVPKYIKILDSLFYLNFIIVLFQYFVLGYDQDYLGGLFGTHVGTNDTTIVFLCIVMAKSILEFMNGREKLALCGIKCIMSLMISVFAELKVFFLLLLLIVCLGALLTKFTFKKVLIIILYIVAVFVGAKMLEQIFSNWKNWFTLERILSNLLSENGYTNSGDMNRLTSIPIAWRMFLTTWPKRLFGMGLGNCDSSAFSFLQTSFYSRYSYLHYHWFSAVFMLMETGIVGLFCYVFFFLQIFKQALKVGKNNSQRIVDCQLAQVLSIVCIVLIIYHQSLRTEAGYMMYFALSLPFIEDRKLQLLPMN